MSDLESRFASTSLDVSTLKSQWDNILIVLQKLNQEIVLLKAELSVMGHKFSNHQYDLKSAIEDFRKLKDLVATIREEFSRNLTTEKKALFDNIEKKHEAIAKVSEDHSAMIKRFEALFEEIALNSKNALLKAANAEMLVDLNRKKVENVRLMVQNQQLQK